MNVNLVDGSYLLLPIFTMDLGTWPIMRTAELLLYFPALFLVVLFAVLWYYNTRAMRVLQDKAVSTKYTLSYRFQVKENARSYGVLPIAMTILLALFIAAYHFFPLKIEEIWLNLFETGFNL
ncbi:unnamed protein product [Caenorhabditis auriculariae]|uniref:Uncharacterized protein n=1 Tax=Caenorhabditis auriculariae TaxID=2777116 RepID=A0A8S1H3Z0_9PELO|nr:unnamed protein product [Caenorhabditis auriculariae]